MRRVAIIGSGVTGLLCAHALVKAGFDVTVFSDRTADQWLNESRPTGTAGRFERALAFERELGLDHWEAQAPRVEGAHLTFCPELARAFISRKMGRSWVRSAVTGRLSIAAGQIRQKLGMAPNHPFASATEPH